MRKLTGTLVLFGWALLAAGAAACSSDEGPAIHTAPVATPAIESEAPAGQPSIEEPAVESAVTSADARLERIDRWKAAALAMDAVEALETNTASTKYVSEGYERAPELASITAWGNSEPFTLESKQGSVVLIDFWTFACINCIRTFPHPRELHEKYADQGLQIVGVHYPEFQFERDMSAVMAAADLNDLRYPIAQDNDGGTWRAYRNRYWPALYLIDKQGFIRYKHFGEGAYEETNRKVRQLLAEAG